MDEKNSTRGLRCRPGVGAGDGRPILGLFNTGVDGAGVPRTNGDAETHYLLLSAPADAATNLRVATEANGFPVGYWLPDNLTSAWIGPNSDGQLNSPVGTYDYRISFTLPVGADLSSVSITGRWATDNPGAILVDGGPTGNTSADFSAYTPFTLNSSNATFTTGVNTLDFLVTNTLFGPTGLRVEFPLGVR